ncbi:bifunctional DNA primase/polymerase [Actinoallomurus sp. CA-142502]|uniref:bifunctional DNA primase/polymerase n=1 Tax=Actinoallomurus sp. CA-142502 TaxID=3239885 RepID=UPI003D8F1A98
MSTQPNPLLDSALAHGWHVFPLRPGDKRPAIHGETSCPRLGVCGNGHQGWEQRAITDPQRVYRCWSHAPYNIGIACGPSGLVVVDLDTPKPGQTPPPEWQAPGVNEGADVLAALAERHGQPIPFDTHMVRTGSGGFHLYFTAPTGVELRNTSGRLGWLIDTRANGGYVVAAGSTVAGRPYETVHGIAPAPLPGWLALLLTEPAPTRAPATHVPAAARASVGRAAGYASAALRNEVQHVLDAVPGNRNHTLNQAAFALGQLAAGGRLPDTLVYDCLFTAGRQIGLSPRECDATIRSGLRSGAHKPRAAA